MPTTVGARAVFLLWFYKIKRSAANKSLSHAELSPVIEKLCEVMEKLPLVMKNLRRVSEKAAPMSDNPPDVSEKLIASIKQAGRYQ